MSELRCYRGQPTCEVLAVSECQSETDETHGAPSPSAVADAERWLDAPGVAEQRAMPDA